MSQLVDQLQERNRAVERPIWVVGPGDTGNQDQRALSLTRTRPRLMWALGAALPVIGRGLQLALPALVAVLASRAFDERRRRPGLALNCPQFDEPEPGGNLSVEVWLTDLILSPGLCVSPSDSVDWAAFTVAYRR